MSNDHKISIIIPCFNCRETLEEAVASVYSQNLSWPFEIVLVDDASTDGTGSLLPKLAEKYPEIRYYSHAQNLGGGATRNTAVEKATGDIVFCLDSDDILTPGMLDKMIKLMIDKNCDGVGISTSIKFRGKNQKDIAYTNHFGYLGEKIPFDSLFEKKGKPMCPLFSTFLFTKKAFQITGGYPTNHGFDTQSFAFRFLANGLIAYGCPGTTYLHRVDFHKSYYLREYEAGRANHNWFKIYEEFLYLFSPKLQLAILNFNLNSDESLSHFVNSHQEILRPEAANLLVPNTSFEQEASIKQQKNPEALDCYWLGAKKLQEGQVEQARQFLVMAYDKRLRNQHLYQKLLQIGYNFTESEKKQAEQMTTQLLAYKKRGRAIPFLFRAWRKIKKIFSHYTNKYWSIIQTRWQSSPDKSLFLNWVWLRIKKILHIKFSDQCQKDNREVVDVVIPTISKDHQLLETVIASLDNLCQRINKIYIISQPNEFIEKFCREHDCIFVDETSILGYGKEAITYQAGGLDRRGWLFQQLLKLSGDKIVEQKNYFVLDSDTVLIKPHNLIEKGKFVFWENEEWHQPYFNSFYKLFGYKVKNRLSFTSHMMVFNVNKLAEMKQELEKASGKPWDQAYISTANPNEPSCISDYDTYGSWLYLHYPEQITRKPLYNRTLTRDKLAKKEELTANYKNRYRSLSFHSYASN